MGNSHGDYAWARYIVGDETEDKRIVKKILGRKQKAIVFLDNNEELIWLYDEDACQTANNYILPAKKLQIRIYASVPRKYQKRALLHLGSMLFNGLIKSSYANDEYDPNHYNFVEAYIDTKIRENFHKVYLVSGGCAALIMAVIWINYHILVWGGSTAIKTPFRDEIFALLINGAFLGALGALISIIQRFKNLQFQLYSSRLSIIMQGITKVVLGLMFGSFVVLAVKAGIFLPDLLAGKGQSPTYMLAIVSLVAGFSERFVPDFLEKIGDDPKIRSALDESRNPPG